MKFQTTLFFVFVLSIKISAQVANTGIMDTTGGIGIKELNIGGYIDSYYGGTFSKVSGKSIPYFVSMNRNNELNINLMYLDVRFHTKNFRARLVPGFGTYVNSNYSAEPGSLKNIIEASAGFKLSNKKNIWLDAGVLGSPYTNESAVSKDQLVYSRSFAPEYVPYYLCGAKLSAPVGEKWNIYLYLLNGWQQIQDVNDSKSLGTQIEFRPNKNALINWNTYIGNEKSLANPSFGMRYFSDIYWIYSKKKWSASACVYAGNQITSTDNYWWQANVMGKYAFNSKFSLSGRVEYFNDQNGIQITSINGIAGFDSYSGSLCFNAQINEHALFRMEARQFYSENRHFTNISGTFSNTMTWLISSVCVWF